MVGDGFCNDETNIVACNYDGGDCCLNTINSEHCSNCTCYNLELCAIGFHPLVGDGLCNDGTNIEECNYDGGDCCGECVVKVACSECVCLVQGDP